ncbi:MAG: CHAD domain-containing protein [Mucilaginibacter sp.]
MKKKAEKAYFDEQWESMTTHLKVFIETGDQEELHIFRVQVKKMVAMLALFDFASSKHQLSKDFKPVRKIFKHAGLIRNAYINLQLGARYHLNSAQFISIQQDMMENETKAFKELESKYLETIKIVYKSIKHDLKDISNKRINDFYNENLQQVASALEHLEFNESLHKARKQIKILLYNRKIAQKALTGKLQVNNDYLDKLQGSIGDWHDNMLAIELFSTPELNDKPVITRIKRQNTRLKKAISVMAKGFTAKAILPVGVITPDHK